MIKLLSKTSNNITNAITLPNVVRKVTNAENERYLDINSFLMHENTIFLTDEINDDVADVIIKQLLYLNKINPNKPINLYINSPGGSVTAGFAIIDTMNLISNPVYTICCGMAASMGSMILVSGEKGHRYCQENAEVMIHQPLGGAKGQASDIQIVAKHIQRTKEKLIKMMSDATGKSIETIEKDMDRDNYLDAKDALEYGIVDKILTHKA